MRCFCHSLKFRTNNTRVEHGAVSKNFVPCYWLCSSQEKLPKLHVANTRLVVSFSFALFRQPLISRPSVMLDKHAADGLESVRNIYLGKSVPDKWASGCLGILGDFNS